jgi:septal ring factor EnvC (AmiA/AmiB activator)
LAENLVEAKAVMFQFSRKAAAEGTSRVFRNGKRFYFSRENIPTISLVIGTCALCFQTMILFPWHQVLSTHFDSMERNVKKMEAISNQLNEQLDELLKLENEIKAKNKIVSNSAQKILIELEDTDEKIQIIKKEFIEE